LQKPAAPFFLQAIAVTADRDHVAVVKEAIEDRGCHHGIAEHRTAVADAAIAGEQDCALLVPAADQLEEEVRGVGFKRQIAEFVDDQELGLGKVREPLLEPTFGMTLGELRNVLRACSSRLHAFPTYLKKSKIRIQEVSGTKRSQNTEQAALTGDQLDARNGRAEPEPEQSGV
jgi:hypothetical protein